MYCVYTQICAHIYTQCQITYLVNCACAQNVNKAGRDEREKNPEYAYKFYVIARYQNFVSGFRDVFILNDLVREAYSLQWLKWSLYRPLFIPCLKSWKREEESVIQTMESKRNVPRSFSCSSYELDSRSPKYHFTFLEKA